MKVLEKQKLSEWTENPTAEIVRSLFQDLLDEVYQSRCDYFVADKPEHTQEVRARLLGAEDAYQNILDILTMNPEALAFFFDGTKYTMLKSKEEVDIEEYGE